MRTLHDIYRCPHCQSIAAEGNKFCRGCGVEFSGDDVSIMRANAVNPVGGLPWNVRDIYRCLHCAAHIALSDAFCRGCGDEICDVERQTMKLRMDEIARQNLPSLIGCMVFVVLVILSLALMR